MALYEEFERRPNRLIDAHSAYLRAAAYQPVGWYEYGVEAFEEARRQDKPVLLDIGAAWCHWCHVIDNESYEDPKIATILNEQFIPIKVDRDERPDIDARYQSAVQLLTGQGGWPLTVFLTPDGQPFYGGTYYPPDDQQEHIGLKTLLPRLAAAYHHHRDDLLHAARAITERTEQANIHAVGPRTVNEETFQLLARRELQRFNVEDGGFEHAAPKFPHPPAIDLALLQLFHTGAAPWRAVVVTTLKGMGYGGIYDQLGGGFHRYAVDEHWTVPHFEKLGYLNGLLLANYARAYRATKLELFREIADGMLDHLFRELSDLKLGGFYNAQDADVGAKDDGSYWTWTLEEFLAPLTSEEAYVLKRYFGVTAAGNMAHSRRNVLRVSETVSDIAAAMEMPREEVEARITHGMLKLRQARLRRKAPAVDTNIYVNSNALLISGCLEAGILLGHADAVDLALRTTDLLLHEAYDENHGMYHALSSDTVQPGGFRPARLPGMLDDQVYMANALLDAFTVNGKRIYLETARHLLDLCLQRYWDDEHGGFLDMERTRDAATDFLRHPRKVIEDLPSPSGNAMAALALDRLWALTGEAHYHEMAGKTLETFADHAPDYGPFAASYGLALFYHLHPPVTVTIIGKFDHDDTQRLRQAALDAYRPGRQLAVYAPNEQPLPYPPSSDGAAVAYVSAAQSCAAPTTDANTLRQTVETFAK